MSFIPYDTCALLLVVLYCVNRKWHYWIESNCILDESSDNSHFSNTMLLLLLPNNTQEFRFHNYNNAFSPYNSVSSVSQNLFSNFRIMSLFQFFFFFLFVSVLIRVVWLWPVSIASDVTPMTALFRLIATKFITEKTLIKNVKLCCVHINKKYRVVYF